MFENGQFHCTDVQKPVNVDIVSVVELCSPNYVVLCKQARVDYPTDNFPVVIPLPLEEGNNHACTSI